MNLVSRICNSYKQQIDNINSLDHLDSMWTHWIKPTKADILVDCYNNDIEKTSYNLANPYNNLLTYGYDDFHIFSSFEELANFNNKLKTDLINLCRSLGLLRVFNPEGGERPDLHDALIINIDIEDILLKLDAYFEFKIDFPDIFEKKDGEYNWLSYLNWNKDLQCAGITTEEAVNHHYNNYGKHEKRIYNGDMGIISSRGIIKARTVHSLHFMSRIKETLKNNLINSTILEIGGGLGRNAYYAKKMGVKKYIIIDIPQTGIMSSYYLGKTLGEENITLFSETTNNYAHILPPSEFLNSKNVDLICQFDGLTEMGLNDSQTYMQEFNKISPLFLSINHEVNAYTVNDLYKNDKNITRLYRFPSWYRQGYVEELLQYSYNTEDNEMVSN